MIAKPKLRKATRCVNKREYVQEMVNGQWILNKKVVFRNIVCVYVVVIVTVQM